MSPLDQGQELKRSVQRYWDAMPCGTRYISKSDPPDSKGFYEKVDRERYGGDDFMLRLVPFEEQRGRRTLEIGCGIGTDMARFARAGARTTGVDLSLGSLTLAKKRFGLENLRGHLIQTDAERLPFADAMFDFVYSWGVLHHTPDIHQAMREAVRVCRPGGELFVMLYHRHSLVALQVWVRYGLLRLKPFSSFGKLLAEHMESPGTRAFTRAEASRLFPGLREISVRPVLTRYDLRVGRRFFLPSRLQRCLPQQLGWFLVIRARKA